MNENSNINQMNVTDAESVNTQAVSNNVINVKKGKNCPNCGNVVSKSASSCPQCGHKLKKKGLKIAIGCSTPFIIIALIIVALMISAKPDTGVIGETYTKNGVEFKVNTIEFANVIDGWGGANDNYWFPLTEESYKEYYSNVQRWDYEGYVTEHGLAPKNEDDMIVFISYTAKNVDKNNKTIDDKGLINYDDGYKYEEGSLSWRRSETAVWQDIPNGIVLEQLEEKEYEFRAYIIVPKEVVESEKSLTYTLFGVEYDLKK